jgi:hypothetical protein
MRLSRHDHSFSNVSPLVVRELRAESRRPINYWLRVLAAAVIIAVFTGFTASTELDASELGSALFVVLHKTMSLAIWIIVPLMTADCISSERREGTLGLLFLTPLTVLDVMLRKTATQMLRAMTLFLACLPVLLLPFMLGGVAWQLAVVDCAKLWDSLLLGMAAGLYASAKGGSEIQVMVMAEGYALVFAIFSAISNFFWKCLAIELPMGWGMALLVIATIGTSLVLFALIINEGARLVRKTWDAGPAAPEQPKWVGLFSGSEFWRLVFYWKRGKALDRNPVAWLQEYSWTARLTKWGWFFVMIFAGFVMLVGFPGCQFQLTVLLSLGVAFSATGSFRRERQSGMLEILLVTPLSARRLVVGRLWGICSHFIPALAVLAFYWNADRLFNQNTFQDNPFRILFPNPVSFLALMVVGLYLSLWRVNFLIAWLLAWMLAFFIPASAGIMLCQITGLRTMTIVALTSAFQIALAVLCWTVLNHNIKERRFIRAPTP